MRLLYLWLSCNRCRYKITKTSERCLRLWDWLLLNWGWSRWNTWKNIEKWIYLCHWLLNDLLLLNRCRRSHLLYWCCWWLNSYGSSKGLRKFCLFGFSSLLLCLFIWVVWVHWWFFRWRLFFRFFWSFGLRLSRLWGLLFSLNISFLCRRWLGFCVRIVWLSKLSLFVISKPVYVFATKARVFSAWWSSSNSLLRGAHTHVAHSSLREATAWIWSWLHFLTCLSGELAFFL